jgi:hypothetical protein
LLVARSSLDLAFVRAFVAEVLNVAAVGIGFERLRVTLPSWTATTSSSAAKQISAPVTEPGGEHVQAHGRPLPLSTDHRDDVGVICPARTGRATHREGAWSGSRCSRASSAHLVHDLQDGTLDQ